VNARSTLVASLALAVAVAALYAPVREFGFLAYDDVLYVTESEPVLAGLTSDTLRHALTSLDAGNWHPVTWISHALDVEWFGLDAGRHHATSVAIHAATSALLWLVLASATRAPWRSGAAAALFALHPLRVESVAWIAERKDVLCGFFVVAALGAELVHARRPSAARLAGVLACGALAMASKAMAVTLPAALLLFDVWPLSRARGLRASDAAPVGPDASLARLALEKLPLFAMALATSALAVRAQSSAGAMATLDGWPLAGRTANALVSCTAYLRKTIWPSDLAVFYPHPAAGHGALRGALAVALIGLLTTAAVWAARRAGRGAFLFGWLWFLGTLAPVIGIVAVGEQAMADRYTYVPSIGLAVAVAWLLPVQGLAARAAAGVACVAVLALALATRAQLAYWRDDASLFERALAVTKDSRVANLNYGNAIEGRAPVAEQIRYFERAIALGPHDALAHYHVARAYATAGDTARARASYERSIALDPSDPRAWNNYGSLLADAGQREAAVAAYRRALAIAPDHASANFNLAFERIASGELGEAAALARRFAARERDQPDAVERLARAFAERGDLETACALVARRAREQAHFASLLAGLEWARGREREAIAAAERAVAAAPASADAANDLAYMLATSRGLERADRERAVALARRALELAAPRREPALLDTLSVALAAAGSSAQARALAEEALAGARAAGQIELARAIEARLAPPSSGEER